MSSTTKPIEVETFEQIEASPRMALLRLIFRASSSNPGRIRASRLLVTDHTSGQSVSPLPSLPAPGGVQRAAFAVPYEWLEGDRSFAIEFEDGSLIELPGPSASPTPLAGPGGSPSAGPRVSRRRPGAPALDRALRNGGIDLEDATMSSDDWLLAEAEARAAAESEAEALRARLEHHQAEAEEHNRELQARCLDLERRLADALAELEAVTRSERRAVIETRQLKDTVVQQASLIDELQAFER
ncbi:MAG TPA: hypothetical protein VGH45_03660 [Solirubrobacteraceae bacterium]|jgi:hypothetical protein